MYLCKNQGKRVLSTLRYMGTSSSLSAHITASSTAALIYHTDLPCWPGTQRMMYMLTIKLQCINITNPDKREINSFSRFSIILPLFIFLLQRSSPYGVNQTDIHDKSLLIALPYAMKGQLLYLGAPIRAKVGPWTPESSLQRFQQTLNAEWYGYCSKLL